MASPALPNAKHSKFRHVDINPSLTILNAKDSAGDADVEYVAPLSLRFSRFTAGRSDLVRADF
jgi:hypothetical protein